MIAATAAAPEGSTTILARSSSITSARDIESSETVRISSPCSWMAANGMSPGRATAMPSAIVVICSSATGAPGAQRLGVGRGLLGLHADDADVGPLGLDRQRDAGEQAAATGRDQHGLDLGRLLEDLQADGALPGDDVGVVEGVDEHRPGLVGELLGGDERLGEVLAVEAHLGAVPRVALTFGIGAPSGMNTVALMPEHLRGERDALRVVAGRGRHDAAGPLLLG